jgi:hypothetical protein
MNSNTTQPPVLPDKDALAPIKLEPPIEEEKAKAQADADKKAVEAARARRKNQNNKAKRLTSPFRWRKR